MVTATVATVLAAVLAVLAVALWRATTGASAEATGLADAVDAFVAEARPALALVRTEERRARDRLDATRWGGERPAR